MEVFRHNYEKNMESKKSNIINNQNEGGFSNYQTIKDLNQQLIQTRSQRIRAAMFPETLEDYGNEPIISSRVISGKPTAVQRLAAPSQMLKTAVLDLINYLDDAIAAQKAIPEILKLLNDEDKLVISKTVALVDQLSSKEASRFAISNSQALVNALLNLINNCNDSQIHRNISSTLHNISSNKNGLQIIFKSGGIPVLLKLLSSPVDSVLFYAITTLHNLLLFEETAKIQVRKCSGIQRMVALLAHNNVKFLAILLDCLHILAYNNSESKLIIAACGGPKELVRIMMASNYEKLLWTTIRLMKVLSICSSNKPALIKNGVLQALNDVILKPLNNRILINCLLTLRNLSDCAIREENLDGLIKRLIEFLNSNTDLNISVCSAGILSNLTCNNESNKIKFVESNGIEIMVRMMVQSNNNLDEIFEPIICSLRHVTNRNDVAFKAQETIRYNYGLPVIVHILQSDSNKWPLIKACIGLIRNLSLSENNLVPLRELGIIPRLVQLLIRAVNFHQQAEMANQDAIVDDVPMEEIIEGTVGALHQLSRDFHNRVIIRELKCIPLLVQLLFMSWESIQRVSCGSLCELANDKESIELIENENVTDRLTELLRSKDEALATYAAAILFRLSEDKPQRLSENYLSNDNKVNSDGSFIPSRNNQDSIQYNTINPYELEMKQQNEINSPFDKQIPEQLKPNNSNHLNTQQQSTTWFDTDL